MSKLSTVRYIAFAMVATCAVAVLGSESSYALQMDIASSNYSDNEVRWISPVNYPRSVVTVGGQTVPSAANWPLRSNRCSPVSGYPLKTFYMQPGYNHFMHTTGAVSPITEPYPSPSSQYDAPLRTGDNAHWSSQCQNTPLTPIGHRPNLAWAFDAGTTTVGVSPLGVQLASQGPWLYPHAIGGWAQTGNPGGTWAQATRTLPAVATDPVHSGQLSDHELGGPACDIGPCGDDYIIWSSKEKRLDNWFAGMVTDARSPFVPGSNPVNPGDPFSVSSNGTTLFRNEFNLTKEQYDRIVAAAETSNPLQGLFLDINADDFYHVYINGVPVLGSATTVQFQQLPISDPASVLEVGQNVIAIQVTDKLFARANGDPPGSMGAGLWYNLRGEVPETTANVYPVVSISPSLIAAGGDATATASIANSGPATGEVHYRHRVWLDRNGNSSYDISDGPPLHLDEEFSGQTVGLSGVDLDTVTEEVTDSSVDQICVGLWLYETGNTAVTTPVAIDCSPIGKYPQVQISGGDLIVRGGASEVSTVRHQIAGGQYGSWVEYSIFAAGDVQSISAAALPSSGFTSSTGGTGLTFANTGATPGNFVSSGDLDFGSRISRDNGVWRNWAVRPIVSGPLFVTEDDIHAGEINTRATGTIRLDGSSWTSLDNSYVIHAENGDIEIRDNITYQSGSYSSVQDLPQMVIIAEGDIVISEGVTRVDAWLIAGDNIYTCGRPAGMNYYSGLDNETCDASLRINGPIQADGLFLRRTGGSEGTSTNSLSEPAEVINFRSDALLWSYGQSSRSQSIRTDTVKELPPRF